MAVPAKLQVITSDSRWARYCPKGEPVVIEPATIADIQAIAAVFISNRSDRGLFQEPVGELARNLADFLVARDALGSTVGCLGLHRDTGELAEVYGVAVLPKFQGQGIGTKLLQECKRRAVATDVSLLWLATVKPEYFSRYSFRPASRWDLPAAVLLRKFRLVFQQPVQRWVPVLLGRHTFMTCDLGKREVFFDA